MSRTIETWQPIRGYNFEKSIYHYDSNNFLIGIESFDSQGFLKLKTKIVVNEKGYPTEMFNYNNLGVRIGGYEKAIYIEDKEKWIYVIYSSSDQEIRRDTLNFNQTKIYRNDPKLEYNDHNEITKYDIKPTGYKLVEYTYDQMENPIQKKYYDVVISKNGKTKKKLKNTYQFIYEYKK